MSDAPRRPELAVAAVSVSDGRLLMIRRGHGPAGGRWAVPGGRVEWGETVAEAVVRELREETALQGVCGPMLGWAELISDQGHFLVMDFEVTILDDADPTAGDDAAEAEWVPLHEVSERRLVPGLAEFLADHGIIDLIA